MHRQRRNDDIVRFQRQFGFTEDRLTQLLDAFSVFDKNGDDLISQDELSALLTSLGHRPSEQQVLSLIRRVEPSDLKVITLERFLALMSSKNETDDDDDELRAVFDIFDWNSDGVITFDDLADILQRLGEDLSEEEVMQMIKEADTNSDGAVNYSEFKKILNVK